MSTAQLLPTLAESPEELLAAQVDYCDALVELSTVHSELRSPAKAVPLLRRATEMLTSMHGEESEQTLECNDMLAKALGEAGEAGEVVPTLRRSLDIKRLVHGESSQEVADCHNELAVALQEMGESAMAEEQARSALTLHIDLFGESHVYTGTCICNLATLLHSQGKLHPAEMLLRHCVRIYEAELGKEPTALQEPHTAHVLSHCPLCHVPPQVRRTRTQSR